MQLQADAPELGTLPAHVDVAIVGSGFAGLNAAIRLRAAGREFAILERAGDLGGTWRDNSYPGCACDVPSHLYSFSYALNPDWSRSFSPQAEIFEYLKRTAREYGVDDYIYYNAEVVEARWDDTRSLWVIETARGHLTANVLILGTGGLSEPSVPTLPGLENFEGTTFHSATWRHDHDLTGERVAVIGTGASAIQFVPHAQQHASHLTVFQRTAPWVLPRRDRDITPVERRLYRWLPGLQRALRGLIYWARESWIIGFTIKPGIMRAAERQALRFLHSQVADRELRRKLTPRYRLGCKRVLLSNDYLPALTQPNVDLVTDRILKVLPDAVVTQDANGVETTHEVDTIIFGTGFHVTDPPIAKRVHGADGRTVAEHWSETGMSALNGLAIAGFPNAFMLVGPNTGLGHTSIVVMIEAQVDYIVDALRKMKARGITAIEPRADVQVAYNERLQQNLEGTVWNAGGCASWYLDERGRNTTLWPTFTFRFQKQVSRCDLADYVLHFAEHGSAVAATPRAEVSA